MKKLYWVILFVLMGFSLVAASKPSLDGRAIVAESGDLPKGLFAKSPGYMPGDTVVVTNPQANISIEVMIFGTFDATEGIAIVLSPEAAKELYITKGSNVIVQVTKKGDAYSEKTFLSKTLQNYVPNTEEEFEEDLLDSIYNELIQETESESSLEINDTEEVIIPLEEILVEPLVEEIIAEEIEEVPAEEVIVEELEEVPAEEILFEELLETPADETLLAEVENEFVSEMEESIEEELVTEEIILEDEIEFETTEEIALVPTEVKPPVFTIIPVPVEENYEEIIEDAEIYDEPEVIFIEDLEEVEEIEESSENEGNSESRSIIPVENEIEIVVEEVVNPTINTVEKLESGKYFVQIATYSNIENVEKILSTYGNNYPIVCYQPSGRSDYQVMIGGLNKDEYAIVLERFRKAGYKDAFLRTTF